MGTIIKKHSRWFVALADAAAVALAYWLAFMLRFDFQWPGNEWYNFTRTLPLVLALLLAAFYFFGLYRGLWRYASIHDLLSVFKAVVVSQMLLMAVMLFFWRGGFPRSVLVIGPVLTLFFVGGIRFAIRLTRNRRYGVGKGPVSRVLIFGAGDLGETIVRDLQRSHDTGRKVVAFLDDNALKHGRSIHGVPVLGGRGMIGGIIARKNVDEVVVAVAHARGKLILDLMTLYAASGCGRKVEFKTVPGMDELINKRRLATDIRRIDVSDLMHRRVVDIDMSPVKRAVAGRSMLVTGAGGTIGAELARQIAAFGPSRLALLETHNTALFYIDKELRAAGYGGVVVPVAGDIRDESLLKNVFEAYKPAWVLHAAAHKHVALMEGNPQEAVKNNTLGTYMLARAAAAYNAERFLLISTDKAVRPSSVMGATKRLAEMAARAFAGGTTRFMSVRFGNVLGSSGSVVKIFQEQIAAGGPVTVTHPDVIRYFMTTEEAVTLVLKACSMGDGGEIFVLNMGEPVRIADLARNMIVMNGLEPGRDIEISYTGLKAGEKMYEEMFRAEDVRRDTGHSDIFAAVPGEAGAALTEAHVLELKSAAASAGHGPVMDLIKRLVPAYTGWPRSSGPKSGDTIPISRGVPPRLPSSDDPV
ncbi:MAG: polysaccharide biosynthesis protein CapD [Elusimicrobia bacterium]|nr:MAG: polysaccharide biosynthesis protein CapD [Elusimicrobiota bacterium]KAF0155564.1 MAG: polysaccharide biosynthesis protein CapD [Elusimicrobiota bacterium]